MDAGDTFEVEGSVDIRALPNFRPGHSEFDEFEPEDASVSEQGNVVHDKVRAFLVSFQSHVHRKDVNEIAGLYDSAFRKLSDIFYKNIPWPSGETVAPIVNHDKVFLVLYKELYYRHIYSIQTAIPTLEQRFESWQNYCDLFALLSSTTDLALPLQWLWDIVDEFIYQFQSFAQHRHKLKSKPKEGELLKSNPSVWNVVGVLNHLESFAVRAGLSQLADLQSKEYTLQQALGYFSTIGLLRVHTLLGDYHLALNVVKPINIADNKGLHYQVSACHISLYYYLGFAYLMMHHYAASVKVFTNILSYINRTEQYHTRSYQFPQIVRKSKQMYHLLAIAVALSPGKLSDGYIERRLNEKFLDKMQKIQRRDEAVLEEMFFKSCPKFVSPNASTNDSSEADVPYSEPRVLQFKVFLEEVRRHASIPTIRSFLKLYTTITVPKLATFLECDEQTCRALLLCYKNKTKSFAWNGGSTLDDNWISSSDVAFHIDETDMVHIADTKISKRYGEFFIHEIKKSTEIAAKIE